jgi:hypothetical protein
MSEQMMGLVRQISALSLQELAPVFRLLAAKVNTHRAANNGFTPKDIFVECLAIGGSYVCLEVVVSFKNRFFLKQRGSNEQGWQGKYGITGVTVRPTDSPADALKRVSQEIFGPSGLVLDQDELEFIGVETHSEPERGGVICHTLVYLVDIHEILVGQLDGPWAMFDLDDDRVIDHHRNTLRWVSNPNRLPFVRLS